MFTTRSFARITALGILFGAGALVAAGSPVSARTAVAGPPWISIETPVNPYDATTKDAYLLVHAFHHGTPVAVPVSGTAEGIVNGERRSVKLEFTPTSRAGAFALRKQWGDAGIWTLVIAVHQHDNDAAQALVEVGADGEVTRIQVPTRVGERNYRFPRELSAQEIDSALRLRAQTSVAKR
ncbi:MAG: hypothetical protein JWL61_1117 [Gemmatimonadetes bacterium]|nr:hypothetical protein [Gemmatimonadota bacterium]